MLSLGFCDVVMILPKEISQEMLLITKSFLIYYDAFFAPMYVSCVPHKSQILFDLLCFNLRVMTLDEGPRSQGPMNSSILYWSKALNWSQEGLQTRGPRPKNGKLRLKPTWHLFWRGKSIVGLDQKIGVWWKLFLINHMWKSTFSHENHNYGGEFSCALRFCHFVIRCNLGFANYHKVLQPSKQNTPRGLPIVLFSQLPEEQAQIN